VIETPFLGVFLEKGCWASWVKVNIQLMLSRYKRKKIILNYGKGTGEKENR